MHGARCRIRRAVEADLPRLEEIYLSQEGHALPEGYFEDFRGTIRDTGGVLYLVAEAGGKVVGGGGIGHEVIGSRVHLSFGIVHAQECGKGYGTDLLLSRLVSFEAAAGGCEVLLEATEWSAGFFRKMGFTWYGVYRDEQGYAFAQGRNILQRSDQESARRLLEQRRVSLAW